MPKLKTGFSSVNIKHHFDYLGWAYFVLPLVMILSWSLIYTVTEPRTPEEKVLSLYIVGNMIEYDKLDALKAEVEASPGFEEMEEFDFLSVELNDISDYYNWQRFTTYLYAQQGDVYVIDRSLFQNLATQGTFVPLEGLIDADPDIDLTDGYVQAEEDTQPRLYGIPTETLYGFMENELYDNRDTVVCITAFSGNQETSLRLVEWLFENRSAPKPAYYDRMTPKEPFYPEGFFDNLEEWE